MRLTFACNNRCLFCLDGEQGRGQGHVPFAELARDLRRARSAGMRRVVLSGGEPTLHPRFVDVVREAFGMGYTHAQVITNGRRFCYPRFLDECVRAGLREATFSMHGHNARLHDRLVGAPGAFIQSLAGLRGALRRPELIVSVDVVLNRLNIERLEEALRFYIRLGVREFDLLQIVPFGRAWENWDSLSYDPESHEGALRRALSLSRTMPGVRLWTNRLAAGRLEGFEDLIQPPEKLHDEVRGRAAMFRALIADGTPPPCRGERCPHCFLEGFCRDLLALREQGSMDSLPKPRCLMGKGTAAPTHSRKGPGTATLPGRRRRVRFPWRGAKTGIAAWTDFYIGQRYFVKGRACSACAQDGTCAGAHIGTIRKRGFSALKPVRDADG